VSSRLHDLLSIVVREFGPRVVSVTTFGSRVKGDARPDSDYDMIIIMEQLDPNPNMREEFTSAAITNILFESGSRISPIVLTRKKKPR
jgi:predicted nucleotidyltransferase